MVFMPHWPPHYPATGQIEHILELLGNPHKKLPPTIHIAGTNGKGSTTAILQKILATHNKKIHCFTSPHLLEFNENFIIANQKISDDLLYKLTEEIRHRLNGKINPGFFEFQTALAFLAFSLVPADFTIIEAGMGAKLDPTNIIENPILSVITPISMDHQKFLGDNLAAIALDKSYIIKNSPVICAPQTIEAKNVIDNFAEQQKVKTIHYGENYDYDFNQDKIAYIDIEKEQIEYYDHINLPGTHQITNFITALSTAKAIPNLTLDKELVNQAIKNIKWPCRLENIHTTYNNIELWIDGAHNEGAANALAQWIEATKDKEIQDVMIYGRSEHTNHYNFLKYFQELYLEKTFIRVTNEPSSETIYNFEKFLQNNPEFNIEIMNDLEEVLFHYINQKSQKFRIIICGSLYLYRDLENFLK